MRRRLIVMSLAAIVSMAACGKAAPAQVVEAERWPVPPKDALVKTTASGPLEAVLQVWPPAPTLGDFVYAQLSVDAEAGVTFELPAREADTLGRFKIEDYRQDTHRTASGGLHRELTYKLSAPSSGRQRLVPFRFEMIDGRAGAGAGSAARPIEILTDEVPLQIGEVQVDKVAAALAAPAGAIDADVGREVPLWIYLVIIGLAALALGYVLVRVLRARRRVQRRVSAYEDAITRLGTLQARGAPSAEAADAWFVELSRVVRMYLEGRYEIRAPELTTEEFLQQMQQRSELAASHKTLLAEFLERCDRVKFAGYRPDAEVSLQTLAAARAFVEDTRVVPVAATPAVGAPIGGAA